MTDSEILNSGVIMNIPQGIDRRTSKNGEVSYRVRIRIKGHQPISKTFKNLTHAKRWKRLTESAVEKGEYLSHAIGESKTLLDAINRYLLEVLPYKPKDAKNVRRHLMRWKKELGLLKITKVSPSDIARIRDLLLIEKTSRGKDRSPSTVVRYLASLSHLFSIAINEWGWVKSNPVSSIKKPKNATGRIRYLSQDEASSLLRECKKSKNHFLYTIVLLALQTGMRQGEILSLTWGNIDFENKWVSLQKTKNDLPRTISLSPETHTLLKKQREEKSANSLVFPSLGNPNRPIDIRAAWKSALKRAGIEGFVFHDLRHTTASYLAMKGYGYGQIAEILGHKSLQMTKRYAHLSHEHKRNMLKTMENIGKCPI